MTVSVFQKYEKRNYPYQFAGQLHVSTIAGGTPSDPKKAEGFIKSKLAAADDIIREEVAQLMVERGIDAEEAADALATLRHLNGFRRDEHGLYIEGRQLKACLKEAAMVAVNAGNLNGGKTWGVTNKGMSHWLPEHVFVVEDRLPLGVDEPSDTLQRFVHTHRGSAIQYSEVVHDAKIDFTVETDYKFKDTEWAALWLTAERQGLGALRSQGLGRFVVTRWETL